MKRIASAIQSTLRRSFDKSDIPMAVFFIGLILVAYGAAQFANGLGALLAGLLLIFYVKPLSGWFK